MVPVLSTEGCDSAKLEVVDGLQTYRVGIATSRASVSEAELCRASAERAVWTSCGKVALKLARNSSFGFCELVLQRRSLAISVTWHRWSYARDGRSSIHAKAR